jgi:hypothetical protein
MFCEKHLNIENVDQLLRKYYNYWFQWSKCIERKNSFSFQSGVILSSQNNFGKTNRY